MSFIFQFSTREDEKMAEKEGNDEFEFIEVTCRNGELGVIVVQNGFDGMGLKPENNVLYTIGIPERGVLKAFQEHQGR
jgi:hypothetical protein